MVAPLCVQGLREALQAALVLIFSSCSGYSICLASEFDSECTPEITTLNDKDKSEPLIMYSALGVDSDAQRLISAGADANSVVEEKLTPLGMASRCWHLSTVKELIRLGAKVDLRFSYVQGIGKTCTNSSALFWAVMNYHIDVANICWKTVPTRMFRRV
ncbi:MAG TPA: ankyrin repeat domain-containing protein [Methanosarcina sp.]|nr:ankyrin repeat domain-containing protein [Methanosarcina sp.]